MYEVLRKTRQEKGISCRQMGIIIGCNKASYSKKERGIAPVSLQEAQKISIVLGESIDKLFKLPS